MNPLSITEIQQKIEEAHALNMRMQGDPNAPMISTRNKNRVKDRPRKERVKMIVLMIDTETTALNPNHGVLRQFGCYAVRPNPRAKAGYDEEMMLEVDFPVLPSMWDSSTLQWAIRNGTAPEPIDPALTDYDSIQRLRDASYQQVSAVLKGYLSKWPKVAVVFRHPEFDIPFLEQAGIDIRRLVGHRNVYDLSSLLIGFAAGRYPSEDTSKMIDGWHKRYPAAHTAVEDCKQQMRLLASVGFAGLPAYYS